MTRPDKLIGAARTLVTELGQHLDIDASVRLWDGTTLPLGHAVSSPLTIGLTRPGTVPSIVRWPTLDRIIRHYAAGDITLEGGTLVDICYGLAGARANVLGMLLCLRFLERKLPRPLFFEAATRNVESIMSNLGAEPLAWHDVFTR